MDVNRGFAAARLLVEAGYKAILVGSGADGANVAVALGRAPSLAELIELSEVLARLGLDSRVEAGQGGVRVRVLAAVDDAELDAGEHANGDAASRPNGT